MDARTLEALKGSIAKWSAIVDGGQELGWKHCPLCLLFNNRCDEKCDLACNGCPVFEASGKRFCVGTPYGAWEDDFLAGPKVADTARRKALAQAELDFLRSLLPERER